MKELVLEDIRSHYNVGAIFRTADGAGVSKVWLSGYTPAPIDRFGRPVGEIHKTALGAELVVSWEVVDSVIALIQLKKQEGYVVVAVEQSPQSISLPDFVVPNKVLYIVGSETEGVSKEVLAAVDVIVEIPMLGQKESLNVSVATGIVLYH